ncbi:hypothetical protein EDC01DRAFT_764789 [Geopyxis carbonaria]|nr:hypothetical protein EDC01DRAFT_764789 [Geopyxis carbonaria]
MSNSPRGPSRIEVHTAQPPRDHRRAYPCIVPITRIHRITELIESSCSCEPSAAKPAEHAPPMLGRQQRDLARPGVPSDRTVIEWAGAWNRERCWSGCGGDARVIRGATARGKRRSAPAVDAGAVYIKTSGTKPTSDKHRTATSSSAAAAAAAARPAGTTHIRSSSQRDTHCRCGGVDVREEGEEGKRKRKKEQGNANSTQLNSDETERE